MVQVTVSLAEEINNRTWRALCGHSGSIAIPSSSHCSACVSNLLWTFTGTPSDQVAPFYASDSVSYLIVII